MRTEDSSNWSAFMAGALIGAGVALLLAPQSGTELRSSLRDYASKAKDELDEATEQGRAAWDSRRGSRAGICRGWKANAAKRRSSRPGIRG